MVKRLNLVLDDDFQFFLVATLVIIFPGCLNILWLTLYPYPNHAPLHRGTTGSVGIDQQYSVLNFGVCSLLCYRFVVGYFSVLLY